MVARGEEEDRVTASHSVTLELVRLERKVFERAGGLFKAGGVVSSDIVARSREQAALWISISIYVYI